MPILDGAPPVLDGVVESSAEAVAQLEDAAISLPSRANTGNRAWSYAASGVGLDVLQISL